MKLRSRAPVMQAPFRILLVVGLAISFTGAAVLARFHTPAARWALGLSVVDIAAFSVLLFVNIRYGR